MSQLEILTLVVVVVVALSWYLSYTAARLDRLHTRVEGTFAALDAQLIRRAEAALELANSGLLDPAASLFLAGAASDCLDESVGDLEDAPHDPGTRELVESDLTQALRLVIGPEVLAGVVAASSSGALPAHELADDPELDVGTDSLQRLDAAHRRAQLARRFHNDAVTDVVRVRQKPLVRLFRLAGHAELPRTVDLDDDLTLLG